MERILKAGDTLVLDDNTSIQVLSCLEYNDEPYAYVYIIPNTITDILSPEKLDKTFVKEIVKNDKLELEEVVDDKLRYTLETMVIETTNKK